MKGKVQWERRQRQWRIKLKIAPFFLPFPAAVLSKRDTDFVWWGANNSLGWIPEWSSVKLGREQSLVSELIFSPSYAAVQVPGLLTCNRIRCHLPRFPLSRPHCYCSECIVWIASWFSYKNPKNKMSNQVQVTSIILAIWRLRSGGLCFQDIPVYKTYLNGKRWAWWWHAPVIPATAGSIK
jgi:hypothetical protein